MAFAVPPSQSTSTNPTANSPPNKRRANDLTLVQPAALKRRKMSNWSQSSAPLTAHPLRQTSFPLEPISPFARSPSVDTASHVSGSQVSAPTAGPLVKKRPRKPKLKDGAAAREQTPKLLAGRAPVSISGLAGGDKDAAAGEDEDDADGPINVAVDSVSRTQEQKQEETKLRAMLVQAFDASQYHRYELWRAAKLTDGVVRRIINATVSQSVPQNVILAVKSVSKLFAGQIIDAARQVQTEWIALGERQTDLAPTSELADQRVAAELLNRRGPLRPDHLREAWRRYRASGAGGAVGLHGLWHGQQNTGVERFSVKTGNRILF